MQKNRFKILTLFILLGLLAFGCGEKKDALGAEKNEKKEEYTQTEVLDKEDVPHFQKPLTLSTHTVTFEDGFGENITLHKNPKRVVGLVNSYLGLWDLAGGDAVGRIDSEVGLPKAFEGVEPVGSLSAPSMEKILSLEPDLILMSATMSKQVALIKTLKENHIEYMAIDYQSFEDYQYYLYIMATLTGRKDLYDKNAVSLSKEIEGIKEKAASLKGPSVLLLLATSKDTTARCSNSMVGKMLSDLGALNIADEGQMDNEKTVIFSLEKIIEKDPDVILYQTMGSQDKAVKKIHEMFMDNPAWKDLKAVKEERVFELPKDLFTYKPNERFAESYLTLAKILYPDAF